MDSEKGKYGERTNKILDIIIRLYIDSADPVGSKAVSDQMELSSATVRNVMSDLERSGFINQPHTSAGRIPTEKGYRYYVDFLMEPEDITPSQKESIESLYGDDSRPLEDLIEESSHILSLLSSLAGIVMFPRTKVLEYILEGIQNGESNFKNLITALYDDRDKIYFDGTHHILEQPEFRDSDKMKPLFKALEEKRVILDIFKEDLDSQGTRVHIGSENRAAALKDCSIISSSYRMRGNPAGSVGVLGPIRMEYRKLVSMVDYLAKTMTNFLDNLMFR